ncbi:MAG: hypothetical protein JO332_19425, partial [Planctomycetaceae bacterium]|nr:hypothetical protein [Planctomycetaceae bacterium]
MRLPRRRLRPTRRLGRPGRPAGPPPSAPSSPLHDSLTELDIPSVLEELPPPSTPQSRSQESTVEMMAVQEEIAAPPRPVSTPPRPPKELPFQCDCGAQLLARSESYDRNSRCTSCQAVMLLSLVYDPDQRSYEIVPFRSHP